MQNSGTSEAIILVKASPQIGKKNGETVCCAGITIEGNWVRLYPISFRILDDAKRFQRWDRIRFNWRKPKDDLRPESLHIDHSSIEIIGHLKKSERKNFLSRLEVTSLSQMRKEEKSLALLRPQNVSFFIEKKTPEDLQKEREKIKAFFSQDDLFNAKPLIPYEPCPYAFKYRYSTEDGEREGTCQDWETDATFFKWQNEYGEELALKEMQRVFGEEYPKRGMVFAMGTHSQYPETWLINAIIRLDEIDQLSLDL